MEFLEEVQSKYQKYHKKNKIPELRKQRTEEQKAARKQKRLKKMDEGRNLQVVTPNTKTSPKKKESPRVDRLTKLKMWKLERDRKIEKQKAAQKPLFKVGAAKDIGFPALNDETSSFAPKNHTFKPPTNLKLKKEMPKEFQRVTRSQKPVASPPLPLPVRTKRKLPGKDGKENIVDKKKLQRQNAVEVVEEEKKTRRKSLPAEKTPKNFRTVLDNITPENKGPFISPYVTTSRGKGSVRKENLNRSLRGLPSFTESSPAEVGAAYYFTVLNNEISYLTDLCQTWTSYKNTEKDLTEDAKDLIDVAVGQANLLMRQKFKQFEDLIKKCQAGIDTVPKITCEDLQGFWDMVYIQVDNLKIRFNKLTTLKENNWKEIEVEMKPKVVKKRPQLKKTKSAASSGIRAAILAARKKTQDSTTQESTLEPEQKDESVFNGGFFVIRTPSKDTPNKLTKATPKSILKSTKKKPVAVLNKSVLFKDDGSEDEAQLNTTFEKSPPKKERRSSRRKSVQQVLF